LTGGIGSGKSYVAKKFMTKGIPVYFADKEAKRLMIQDKELKSEIKTFLGKGSYHRNGRLNRPYVANKIFSDKKLLEAINGLVHPAVGRDFTKWSSAQNSKYVLEESAIIFENGLDKNFDSTILVAADKALRVKRVMKRDNVTEEQVIARMIQQLPDKKKLPLATFVIRNNEAGDLDKQISSVHKEILRLIKN